MLDGPAFPGFKAQRGRLVDVKEDVDGAGEQQTELPLDGGRLVLP